MFLRKTYCHGLLWASVSVNLFAVGSQCAFGRPRSLLYAICEDDEETLKRFGILFPCRSVYIESRILLTCVHSLALVSFHSEKVFKHTS